jgi:hypothetical protein
MEFIAFAISVPGATVLLLFWVLHVRADRRRFLRSLEAHHCKVCGADFSDALVEDLGRPSPAVLARLDAFQRRFAHRVVQCQDCGGVNICAKDGVPFRGLAEV